MNRTRIAAATILAAASATTLAVAPAHAAQPASWRSPISAAVAEGARACGAGDWREASATAVSPGALVMYRSAVSGGSALCAVFVNTSGHAQKMSVNMIAQPRPGGGSLTATIGHDSGTYRSYAGPIKHTFRHGIKARAFAYGPNGASDFVETIA